MGCYYLKTGAHVRIADADPVFGAVCPPWPETGMREDAGKALGRFSSERLMRGSVSASLLGCAPIGLHFWGSYMAEWVRIILLGWGGRVRGLEITKALPGILGFELWGMWGSA